MLPTVIDPFMRLLMERIEDWNYSLSRVLHYDPQILRSP